jgi:hypothetical protein
MAGMFVPPNMQEYYGIDAYGQPNTGATTQPATPNPPQATGKGPTATGKGSLGGAASMPAGGYAQGRPGDPGFFQQDPMASRGVQSMGLAQPFYMANVADLARPQMAGQASYMRQMAGLGYDPMAQAPTVSPMPPAQFPSMPPPATFGGQQPQAPVASGKGPAMGGGPATGKMPNAGSAAPVAGGKMPSTNTGYLPPQTPETETMRPAVEPPMAGDISVPEPTGTMTGSDGGASAAQPEGNAAPKQAGGSMYGFDTADVRGAQDEMIRRAIDAAVQVGPKS